MIKPVKYIKNLIPYTPGKPVEELEREISLGDIIKIASNENALGPSPKALKAIYECINKVHRYPDGDCYYLREKLSAYLSVNKGNILFGNGSNEVIEIAARTFMKNGDEAIMGQYAFIVYPLVTKAVGAKTVISPMPGMIHDMKDMYSRISPKTKMIFLANPNNPTGTIVKKQELEWFLKEVPEDIIVLVDEAYFEYVDYEYYPNSLEYHSMRESLITVRTFSKIFGLAGLRLGYCISKDKIISYMNRVREPFNVNSLAQHAAISALDDHRHVKRTKYINDRGMSYLEDQLSDLGIKFYKSYTNFILIDLCNDPIPVYNALLSKGVIVRPVQGYGLKTHLRVSIGLDKENKRFIKALKEVIN